MDTKMREKLDCGQYTNIGTCNFSNSLVYSISYINYKGKLCI